MSGATDDGADEVKVFRRNDADDVESAQSSHQLTEDKKDVALETELETRTPTSSLIGSKSGAFVKLSPSFPTFPTAALSPSYGPLPLFYPFFIPNQSPYGLPFGRMPSTPMDARTMSPSYAAAFVMQQAAQSMSPTFDMYRNFPFAPGSPLQVSPASASKGCNPFTAVNMVRNMSAAAAAAAAAASTAPQQPTPQHPLNSINQMRLPQMNSPITSMASNLAHHHSHNGRSANTTKTSRSEAKLAKEQHIKKPLNAFMWFMKENRPKLMEELDYKERQSAELNKELGRRWHDLPKEEQQKYYDLAKNDREEHMQKYPNWSARENYAVNKKKKRKRDKSVENGEQKKCRARFGVINQDQWCKHCKRKKRCLWYREATSPMLVSSTTPGTPGTPSSISGRGLGPLSGRETDDSETEMDGDGRNQHNLTLISNANNHAVVVKQQQQQQQGTPLIC